jgi:hypothetical protein
VSRLFYPATERNREPILAVVREVWPQSGHALEIASGSGEHVTFLAEHFPGLRFLPSDPSDECRASIDAWRTERDNHNVEAAIELDVCERPWAVPGRWKRPDLVVCINMIHIAPWEACEALVAGAAESLAPDGVLFLYGPFMRGGQHTAPSNEAFDERLRGRDSAWGVRDLDVVTALAERHGLALQRVVEMPANNLSVAFRQNVTG